MILKLLSIVTAVLASSLVEARADVVSNIFDACSTLSFIMPDNVAYPNSSIYAQEMNYWSALQGSVRPRCLVLPKCTKDVSTIMVILTSFRAPFTVKSGGHTAFAGGSNIEDGVTVNLVYLNNIEVSQDRKTVSVGSGLRWVNISTTLDPMNLAVLGGRDANVGVSGLLLGGGFSFFSGRHGWACDNVKQYEVVLSSGKVAYASPRENSDLYKALRGGGGSSFGIVTRFDLMALEQGDMWTNSLFFPGAMNGTVAEKFTDLALNDLDSDPDAHTYFVIIKPPETEDVLTLTTFYHSIPPPENQVPSAFLPFQSLPGALDNTTMVTNVTTLTYAIANPYGSRHAWSDLSYRLTSASLLQEIVQIFEQGMRKILAVAGSRHYSAAVVYQPITRTMMAASQKNGGNSMNLNPEDGTIINTHFFLEWQDPELDDLILSTNQNMVIAARDAARRHGAYKEFAYMNYAGNWQDVFKGYGEEGRQHLRAVAAKYDPKGHLRKLWRGYFKP